MAKTAADLLVEIKQAPEADGPRRQFGNLLIADDHARGRFIHAQLDAADPTLPAATREAAAARADAEFEAALTNSDQRARRDLGRGRPSEWTRVRPRDQELGECAMRLVVPDLDRSGQLTSVFTLRYTRGMLTGVLVEQGVEDDIASILAVLQRGPIRRFGCPGPLLDCCVRIGGLRDLHELRVDGSIDVDTLARARRAAPGLRRLDLGRARLIGSRPSFEPELEVAWPPAGAWHEPLDPRLARFERVMAEVIAEDVRADEYDSSWSANPYFPEKLALALAVPEAVPYLIRALESVHATERTWARHALQQLGPAAGPTAAEALERLGHREALFHVDEARARQLGVHRQLGVRHSIVGIIGARGPVPLREHFEALLADPDPDVARFGLGAGKYPDDSGLGKLVYAAPEQVPIALVRRLLDHDDPRLRSGAANVLAGLHLPEDAERVIDRLISDSARLVCRAASWLGSHPRSDAWLRATLATEIERVAELDQIHEILRRRRCAGLDTPSGLVRARVLAALEARAAGPSYDDSRKRAIEAAANIVRELRDPSYASALVAAIGPVPGARPREGEGPFDPLRVALASLGEAGNAAVHAASFEDPVRQQRLEWMRDAMARPLPSPPTLALADAGFIAGELETAIGGGAYHGYCEHLYANPRSAPAAAQIAWIDRGFGVWISPQRIAWLRELGLAESLVNELAERPPAILFGHRFGHPRLLEPDRVRIHADTAMQAGLFGIAANYYADRWPSEAAQAREAAQLQVERSRSAR